MRVPQCRKPPYVSINRPKIKDQKCRHSSLPPSQTHSTPHRFIFKWLYSSKGANFWTEWYVSSEGQLSIDKSTSTLAALEFSFSRIWSRFLWHGGWRISYFLFNISFGSEQRQSFKDTLVDFLLIFIPSALEKQPGQLGRKVWMVGRAIHSSTARQYLPQIWLNDTFHKKKSN